MLDIRESEGCWDKSLEPVNEGTWEKETFDSWWTRNNGALANLHPQIAEQWVYRHWTHSPYTCLPLRGLSWKLETWLTNSLLSIYMPRCGIDANDAVHAYKIFNEYGGNHTAQPMNNTGTWDYPVVILYTPQGVLDYTGEFPNVRHILIEGHQRMRYLNALAARGMHEEVGEHAAFILYYEK